MLEDARKYGVTPEKILSFTTVKKAKGYLATKGYPIGQLEDFLFKKKRTKDRATGKYFQATKELLIETIFDPAVVIEIEPERREKINENWTSVFSRLKKGGWDEERFSNSIHSEKYSGLIDFAKFAQDKLVEDVISGN